MGTDRPIYLDELRRYVEDHIDNAPAVTTALAALLGDPESYTERKHAPGTAFLDFVHKIVLEDDSVRDDVNDPSTPVTRRLHEGRWTLLWRDARDLRSVATSFEYDVCISFADADRRVAEAIANLLSAEPMQRRVFYDEYESERLWGEELFEYLHDVYANKSMFCIVLFSHAYRARAWTRHELRAAQIRTLEERRSYVLPVAIDGGAVPEPFSSVGYWTFRPGEEARIAAAAEEKINAWIGEHYASIEEIAEVISRQRVAHLLVQAFDRGHARATANEPARTARLAVALIAASLSELLNPSVRALVDWVLFSPGAIADVFSDDILIVYDEVGVRRFLGRDGPLLLSERGWKDLADEYAGNDADLADDEQTR